MVTPKSESDWQDRAGAFLKGKLKEADMTYAELADRLRKHGFKDETASRYHDEAKTRDLCGHVHAGVSCIWRWN